MQRRNSYLPELFHNCLISELSYICKSSIHHLNCSPVKLTSSYLVLSHVCNYYPPSQMRNWVSNSTTYVWNKYLLFHNKFNNGKLSSLSFISELSLSSRHSFSCLIIIIISRFSATTTLVSMCFPSSHDSPFKQNDEEASAINRVWVVFVIQLYCHLIISSLDLTNRSRVLLNNDMIIILPAALLLYVGVNMYNILSQSLRIS